MDTSVPTAAPRLFVEGPLPPDTTVELPERAARHCSVLRLDAGDAVILFNGEGGECDARLLRLSRNLASAHILSKRDSERESPLAIELAQCIPSGDRMDLAVQKATELGVRKVVPVSSERSIVKLSGARAERRIQHWRGIAISACEQCGRNRVPEIAGITGFDDFVASTVDPDLRLLLTPGAERDLRAFPVPRSVLLLVGPEGGLAPRELQAAKRHAFLPVRFGPRVLRTETAPLAAIAAMQALWGDC